MEVSNCCFMGWVLRSATLGAYTLEKIGYEDSPNCVIANLSLRLGVSIWDSIRKRKELRLKNPLDGYARWNWISVFVDLLGTVDPR